MPFPLRVLLVLTAAYMLYFHGMTAVGLHGPDEPRYAWIGRAMAESGDWVTPRLWAEPWFEKPALLYWLIAAGFRMGLGDDAAPRFLLAVLSVAFLFAYWRLLREELTQEAAAFAVAILGTSAAWLAYSRTAVTDVPLSVSFALSMLLTMEWQRTGNPRRLMWAGVAMGFAMLAKGLVPVVLAAPLVWFGRKRLWDLWRFAAAALVVALPWYALCTASNGAVFLEDFILKHHLGRFTTSALQHVQPFWFYVPVLLGAVFPWTPLVALLRRPTDGALRFLGAWVVFGFVFFSAAQNKLPGYLLPLLPGLAALLGDALASRRSGVRWVLVAAGVLVAFTPAILPALPEAISTGSGNALPKVVWWHGAVPAAVAGLVVYLLEARHGRVWATAVVAIVVAAMAWRVVQDAFPAIDAEVSARSTWRAYKNKAEEICLEEPRRAFQYGVNYYFHRVVPDCEVERRGVRLRR
ncbi:MAG: glycosyltransferase family 39 protein [Acidobacteria bacterium]|nr:glycosyltransferase family 39 protein [Acidobacteriota bacterium]